jgi:hypothetical protein
MTVSSSNDGSRVTDGSYSGYQPRGLTWPGTRPRLVPPQAVITPSQLPPPPELELPPAVLELATAPLEDVLTPAVLELAPAPYEDVLTPAALELPSATLAEALTPAIMFPQLQSSGQPSGDHIRRSPNPQLPTPPPTPELQPPPPPAPPSTPVLEEGLPLVRNPFNVVPECECAICNGEKKARNVMM